MRLINLQPGVDQQLTGLGDIGNRCDRIRGLAAYDTQRIKEMYDVNDDGTILEAKE